LYAYAYFEHECAYKRHAYAYSPLTIIQKHTNNRTGTIKSNNLTCLRTEKLYKPKLNKHAIT